MGSEMCIRDRDSITNMWIRAYKQAWFKSGARSMDSSPIVLARKDAGRACPSAHEICMHEILATLDQCMTLPGEISTTRSLTLSPIRHEASKSKPEPHVGNEPTPRPGCGGPSGKRQGLMAPPASGGPSPLDPVTYALPGDLDDWLNLGPSRVTVVTSPGHVPPPCRDAAGTWDRGPCVPGVNLNPWPGARPE